MTPARSGVRLLLRADRLLQERGPAGPRFFAPLFGTLHLFLLASYEYAITGATDSRPFSLLMMLEAVLFLVLAGSHFVSVTSPVLDRAGVYPLRPRDRYFFAVVGSLRRPIALYSWAGMLLALVVLHHHTLVEILVPSLLFTMMVISLQCLAVLAFLAARRRAMTAAGVLWAGGAVLFVLVTAALLFESQTPVEMFLPAEWVGRSIHAVTEGSVSTAAVTGSALVLGMLATASIGRRFS